MGFREDCAPYFAKGPIMLHNPNDSQIDGNGLLYTGIYATICRELNCYRLMEDGQLMFAAYNKAAVKPGLLDRGIDNKSPEEHDDYIGMAAAHWHVALNIYCYGSSNYWVYNNMDLSGLTSTFRYWFGRLPGFVAHVKLCSQQDHIFPSSFDRLSWSLAVIFNALFGGNDTSGYKLKWLMVKSYEQKVEKPNRLMSFAANLWKMKLMSRYKGGMGDVFAIDFGPQHPFAIYMKGKV